MAGKKSTSSKSKSNTKKKSNTKTKTAGKNSRKNISAVERHRNVIMLSYLCTGILLALFSVIRGSNIWSSIRGVFFAFFGVTVYLFAAFLIIIGVKLALNSLKRSFLKTNLSFASIVLTVRFLFT